MIQINKSFAFHKNCRELTYDSIATEKNYEENGMSTEKTPFAAFTYQQMSAAHIFARAESCRSHELRKARPAFSP